LGSTLSTCAPRQAPEAYVHGRPCSSLCNWVVVVAVSRHSWTFMSWSLRGLSSPMHSRRRRMTYFVSDVQMSCNCFASTRCTIHVCSASLLSSSLICTSCQVLITGVGLWPVGVDAVLDEWWSEQTCGTRDARLSPRSSCKSAEGAGASLVRPILQ
jgi:hypothetical protein